MQEDSLGLAVNALDRVVSFLKPSTSSKIKSTIVALYSAQSQSLLSDLKGHQLRFSGQIALLHLDYDRKVKNYFLRLYHLQRLTLLLEVQLYYGFMECYRVHERDPSLYYFQYLEDGHFAFLFRTAHEAQIFQGKLKEIAPKQQMFRELKQKEKEEEEKGQQANSFFGRVKGLFQKKQSIAKQESKIVQIRKSSAIMFDNSGSIITENISPEWLQIITNSGLRKADLKKPQIVQTILEEALIYEAARASIKDPSLFGQSKIKQLQQLKFKSNVQKSENSSNLQTAKQINSQQNNSLKQLSSPSSGLNQQKAIKIDEISQIQPNIPIPPPINLLFKQSQIQLPSNRSNQNQTVQTARSNLLQEIRANKVVLKPVKTNEGGHIQIDASSFNKEERKDLGEQIRLRLKRRAMNARRRQDSDQDSQY